MARVCNYQTGNVKLLSLIYEGLELEAWLKW
jgi:hypothetical protein